MKQSEPTSLPLLLTFREAAVLCGISTRSVSRAIRSGDLRAVQAPGTKGTKGLRIPLNGLLAYIDAENERRQKAEQRFKELRDPDGDR